MYARGDFLIVLYNPVVLTRAVYNRDRKMGIFLSILLVVSFVTSSIIEAFETLEGKLPVANLFLAIL